MKLLPYAFGLIFLAIACSTNPYRTPQSVSFMHETEDWKFKLNSRSLNTNECASELTSLRQQITEEKLTQMSDQEVRNDGANILENLWLIRLRLHDQLQNLKRCKNEVIQTFQQLRSIEDLLGDKYYNEKPLNPKDIDYANTPVPFRDNDFYHGYLARPTIANQRLEFQSGDVLLTRGVSFFSAALARIPYAVGQFSHFVMLHRDGNTVNSIESYAQTGGVGIFSEVEALKNENSRILVLRARNQSLAKGAADYMWTESHRRKIPYDFEMNVRDDSKMTCSEVPYHGFRVASNGSFLLPEDSTAVSDKLGPFMKKVGMNSDGILSPRDMEADSRFELVAEFKDYRVLRDLRYRDAILSKMFDWMANRGYELNHDGATLVAQYLVWPLRKTPLFPMIRKLGKMPEIPEGTPRKFFITLAQLNTTAELIYDQVIERDKETIKKTGWPMTSNQLASLIEEIRLDDLDRYMRRYGQTFHMTLHAKDQIPPIDNSPGN